MARSRPQAQQPKQQTEDPRPEAPSAPIGTGVLASTETLTAMDGSKVLEGTLKLPPLEGAPPAADELPPLEEPAQPLIRYRVLREQRIMHRGNLTQLRAGKIVDDSNYRIADLVAQGVELEPIAE